MPFRSACVRPDTLALQHAYRAWYAYIRVLCAERGIPLLELNLFEQSDAELWSLLEQFLGLKRARNVTKFGGGSLRRISQQ